MKRIVALLYICALVGCGGSTGGDGGPTVAGGCSGTCGITSPQRLEIVDVNRILSQAVQEAQARGAMATIAVVDRSGNVLAVLKMNAGALFTITSGRGVVGGLEGVAVLDAKFAAVSKAITGAYLSSEGNAFSTRTASQIVQENFNPGEINSPGGPLFGVQFSSLSCSDLVRHLATDALIGPKGSPLGLSADPGGLPLYKNGTVVGGIGVMADGIYGLDLNISDVDQDLDELVAVAGARGFDAPNGRRADRITADGRTFRYTDSETLASNPSAAPAAPAAGTLVDVPGYFVAAGGVLQGLRHNFPNGESGFRADANPAFAGLNAYVLVDGTNTNRFPPIAGTDAPVGGALTAPEVTRILAEAIKIANRARAQIRQPLGSYVQVTISIVDTNGAILGLIRTPDAPVFGTDVSLQKARSVALFSSPGAGAYLTALPNAAYLVPPAVSPIGTYVTNMQGFIPGGGALTNGVAYSNRAIGNLARPFFPDGINGAGPGPLSKPFGAWSPFSDGLQLDMVINKVVANLLSGTGPALPHNCADPTNANLRAANGIQIFPGSFPIYRGGVLVGGIGISGDGIDQDNMVAFLGVFNAGNALGTGIAHAPPAIRADQILGLVGGQLRYVNCPVAPFLDTTASNVCDGI